MNLTPGGKNIVPMRDGYYTHPDTPNTISQPLMMLPDGHLEGLRIVLQECQRFLNECSIPGNKPRERKLNPACNHATNAQSCVRTLLSSQPDFQA
ncbi:hypothetical protein L873DRAFT_1914749 [Choiromyces venosus 120613-1]|uniref:Uncharacterized protein n=1 Tax=Choiromyces venosus 120613-1 TaxID=1336337 RepID=A0A3N4JX87_9PEZI|nr:hypothetical protein L873DRAFT_1914749 [Choiromyces venosus 120613-1]